MGNKKIPYTPERKDRVFMLMGRENLTQEQLADRMGIAQQRISELLKSGRISDYYLDKICSAFPNYLKVWLSGYGDPEIATKEDLAMKNFRDSRPREEDLTDLLFFMDEEPNDLLTQLIGNIKKLSPIHQISVLETLNKIVEPYTLIPEWENK